MIVHYQNENCKETNIILHIMSQDNYLNTNPYIVLIFILGWYVLLDYLESRPKHAVLRVLQPHWYRPPPHQPADRPPATSGGPRPGNGAAHQIDYPLPNGFSPFHLWLWTCRVVGVGRVKIALKVLISVQFVSLRTPRARLVKNMGNNLTFWIKKKLPMHMIIRHIFSQRKRTPERNRH